MGSLPFEIITDILVRLPAKTLVRFRCVSKPWCFIIDSQDFIKTHLKRSIQTNTSTNLILRNAHLYCVDFDSHESVILDHPLKPNFYTEMLGSCNGLLCLSNAEDDIALWNPSTRKHHTLPVMPIQFSDYQCIIYGFGCDNFNDDYKVVRIVQQLDENDDSYKSEVVVYSLKLNCWRMIEDFPYYLCYRREWGVFVSGALHWAAAPNPGSDTTLIVALDLDVEKYRVVPHPGAVVNTTYMNVGVLGGCLCAICNCLRGGINIWVMKDYGVRESWTQVVWIGPEVICSYFAYVRPLAYSKDGCAILLERELPEGVKLIWYDLKKKRVKNAKFRGIPKSYEAMFFIESLVSLISDGEMNKKQQQEQEEVEKTKNRKKRDDFLSVGFKLVL